MSDYQWLMGFTNHVDLWSNVSASTRTDKGMDRPPVVDPEKYEVSPLMIYLVRA
jgi:hypothetical protein